MSGSIKKPKWWVPVVIIGGVVVFFAIISQFTDDKDDGCDTGPNTEFYKGRMMGNSFALQNKPANCSNGITESKKGTFNAPSDDNTSCWCEGFHYGYNEFK